MESHLEFNELAFDKPENQAGLAGAHIPEKNLAIQPKQASKRISKSPYKTRNPKGAKMQSLNDRGEIHQPFRKEIPRKRGSSGHKRF